MSTNKIEALRKTAVAATERAKAAMAKAKAEGREMTASENAAYKAAMDEGHEALEQIKTLKADQALQDQARALEAEIGAPAGSSGGAPGAKRRGLPITRKAGASRVAAKLAEKMTQTGSADSQKALAPSGAVVTGTPMDAAVQSLADPGVSILDALYSIPNSTPTYRYLRQTARDNNAAVVPVGGTKPTSVYGMEQVDGELKIVAHLSEGIHEYWLRDSASVQQFVETEMFQGLLHAIENEVVNGDGIGERFTGLLTVSGSQTQAFATDAITTVRKAITKLEAQGHAAGLIILNPADWETIELSRTDTAGQLEMTASPVDRAARRLWSTQVVPSTAVAAGTGIVLDTTAVALRTDSAVDLRWSESDGLFEKNELRARIETRAELDVYQPLGIVVTDVAAA
ncbi:MULTISPECIES: phage major capsid protein [Rhodococcus]|uniref:Phage major capsid protein n=1 Tax=Rhodococcus oxybenzonivorans TaxID=1990687 RepID=A0AAE4UV98_9NOCA|nr:MULTISPECIES: phage major capsid protein [Rhodococcus]MDV7245510.1 phage major capsid protein [Rhodococcus oxybenzonivorans]MDV7263311.1 phage major capsid protein [Rhodococcus oxybenzonivorans]MDV7276590.1 phage major capsid protein [Rhodococcus oxybenzonivorans]MDV7336483.1 phage major capsid protein [Rhodococcus oxybenzonivorans]MDV7346814.1 phage major capsid protein [Rhodococcus oxybenzonivorans]